MTAATAFAVGFSSLEERMSAAEFHAAGLDKLSPDELKSLDVWLRAHYATTTKYVTASGAPVFYPGKSERPIIESRIVGTFMGWRGQTEFTLENGQQWKQAESGSFDCGKYENPKVTIKSTLMGNWLMYVQPCSSQSLRVTRIK